MKALFLREMRLHFRASGAGLTACIFNLALIITLPFAIGPDLPLITRLAPSIIWSGVFLSSLLSAETLFTSDKQDGSLDLFILSGQSLSLIVGIKALALFITTAIPLLIALPLMGLVLNLEFELLPDLLLSLALGLPSLTLLATFGAAIAVSFKRGSILTAILILPLAFPVLIFGVGLSHLLLLAMLMIFIATLPFFSALALKEGLD